MLFSIYVLLDFFNFLLNFGKLSYNLLLYHNKHQNLKRPYYSICRGELSVSSRGKRQSFRDAFARVKEMRSFLPGGPVLALTASVKGKD